MQRPLPRAIAAKILIELAKVTSVRDVALLAAESWRGYALLH